MHKRCTSSTTRACNDARRSGREKRTTHPPNEQRAGARQHHTNDNDNNHTGGNLHCLGGGGSTPQRCRPIAPQQRSSVHTFARRRCACGERATHSSVRRRARFVAGGRQCTNNARRLTVARRSPRTSGVSTRRTHNAHADRGDCCAGNKQWSTRHERASVVDVGGAHAHSPLPAHARKHAPMKRTQQRRSK